MNATRKEALAHLQELKDDRKREKTQVIHKIRKTFNNTLYSYNLKRYIRYGDLLESLEDGNTLDITNYKDENITQYTLDKLNKRYGTAF